jgi:hypothetical protein
VRDPASARRTGVAVSYYVFDVLHLEGHDLRAVPLRARKELLRRALSFADPIRFTTHRNAAGEAFLEQACRWGWEGLIAKRADAGYEGRRTTDWLKFKCVNQQEFVVGGFTDPAGSRLAWGRSWSATTTTASLSTRAKWARDTTRPHCEDSGPASTNSSRSAPPSPATWGGNAPPIG